MLLLNDILRQVESQAQATLSIAASFGIFYGVLLRTIILYGGLPKNAAVEVASQIMKDLIASNKLDALLWPENVETPAEATTSSQDASFNAAAQAAGLTKDEADLIRNLQNGRIPGVDPGLDENVIARTDEDLYEQERREEDFGAFPLSGFGDGARMPNILRPQESDQTT
jgi:hypothetical protein